MICNAIKNKQLIQLYYEGGNRIVEPYCHGITTQKTPGLKAYQVSGYSADGTMGWKLFDLSKAYAMSMLPITFKAPREGYNPHDPEMTFIFCQLL